MLQAPALGVAEKKAAPGGTAAQAPALSAPAARHAFAVVCVSVLPPPFRTVMA
jgi:hypothetical protein